MTLRTFASEGPLKVVDVLVERELLLFAELVVADVADELAVDEGGGGVVHPPGDRHDLKRRLVLARHVLYSRRSLNDKNKCCERFTRWLLGASGYNTSKCEVDILASPKPLSVQKFQTNSTRKHSSRMRTARLPTVRVSVATTKYQYGMGDRVQVPCRGGYSSTPIPSSPWTNRRRWKHYLKVTQLWRHGVAWRAASWQHKIAFIANNNFTNLHCKVDPLIPNLLYLPIRWLIWL